ncbi:tRNA (uridine(54)-C5)-methyltransferase TrmA [uncultured Porticoccus sp.]|uniref:tRNA (uridine(54)-C5)-methyltransferase TrmA n=1 Tax=uncultured Porticoccus sp. TaxID=1256050 RepID=UPI00262B3B1D|nr:tRNA (uridine(54)-C5)-methyltransferase TrmA [uncultured Porticoccus sp.]
MQTINPDNYQQQLDEKLTELHATFLDIPLPENIEVYPSEPLHFRMRAEFRIWHENGRAHFAMNEPGQKTPYIITEFPIGSVLINRLMTSLITEINASSILSRRLFSVEFLTTLSGDALITLLYHRKLDDEWQSTAAALQQRIGVAVIGRSRKQKLTLERDYVLEKLQVDNQDYQYQQVEGGFTQPNAGINQQMLAWSLDKTRGGGGDLLELYCGNGNFTCVLAQNFNRVLATEISKISVKSATTNLHSNAIDNVTIVRMSSEDFCQALEGVRPFRRLQDIDLQRYRFSTIFLDPPRAGLDNLTLRLAMKFDNILYISCNPLTLKENLKVFGSSHQIEHFAVFDQFPYTHHLECGVLLKRTNS